MIYIKYLLSFCFVLSIVLADEPISLIIKTRGIVKYRTSLDIKKYSHVKENTPMSHGNGLFTKSKSFAKITYLDDRSTISIFPKTEIIVYGTINNREISKHINLIEGIVRVNILKEKTSEFKLTTPFSKIICSDECDFWIISDKEKGDYYYNKNGYGFISNSSTMEAVKLIADSTFTSLIDSKIEIYETTSAENQYLESLLIDAGENQRENEKLGSQINLSQKSDEVNSNILEIKFKNNLNIERTIYLTYTK